MNLHPDDDAVDPAAPLAPPEWTMVPGGEPNESGIYCFADVYCRGKRMCRVGYAGPAQTADEVNRALARRAREWIAEYLKRSQNP